MKEKTVAEGYYNSSVIGMLSGIYSSLYKKHKAEQHFESDLPKIFAYMDTLTSCALLLGPEDTQRHYEPKTKKLISFVKMDTDKLRELIFEFVGEPLSYRKLKREESEKLNYIR